MEKLATYMAATLAIGLIIFSSPLRANIIYPLRVFSSDGYYGDPNLNLYVEVADIGANQVDFSFHNESTINSSIARIYFDDDEGLLLDIATIAGLNTSFSPTAVPSNLPGAKLLDPSFAADFSAGSDPARPHNGVNPGEEVTITFDLTNGGTFEEVIYRLNSTDIRIGTHVIALPDDSSGSAIAVPEPSMLILLSIGKVLITFVRKRHFSQEASYKQK